MLLSSLRAVSVGEGSNQSDIEKLVSPLSDSPFVVLKLPPVVFAVTEEDLPSSEDLKKGVVLDLLGAVSAMAKAVF